MKLVQEDLHNEIEDSKSNYYSQITYKLPHIPKNTTASWALLKRFLNNKKIPLIPPFLHRNVCYIFQKKAELFNSFFAKQWSLISNSSELPLNLHFTTEKHLDTLNFSDNDTENKAHEHDKISICMIKICSKSFCKPL